jgi:hypothetical protein
LVPAENQARPWITTPKPDKSDLVLPPGKPEQTTPLSVPTIEVGEAAEALKAMALAAQAGLPVTKAAVRDTVTLIREQVRVGRGLPARQTRRLSGQTMRLEHETPEGGGTQDQAAEASVTRNGDGGGTEAERV